MAVKLVASDLDLTLLNTKFEVTPEVKATAHRILDSGVLFAVVTGRMFPAAAGVARELDLDVPIICYNGGMIKRGLSGELIYRRAVEHEIAVDSVKIGLELGLTLQLYIDDKLYAQRPNKMTDYYIHANQIDVCYEEDFLGLLDTGDTMKVLFMGPDELLAAARQQVEAKYGERAYMTTSHDWYLDVLPAGVNKGKALACLSDLLGVEPSEVLAIGDNLNDLPMLEYAGIGVAMGNATDQLKEHADYVTGHTDKGGWVSAIERFVL